MVPGPFTLMTDAAFPPVIADVIENLSDAAEVANVTDAPAPISGNPAAEKLVKAPPVPISVALSLSVNGLVKLTPLSTRVLEFFTVTELLANAEELVIAT